MSSDEKKQFMNTFTVDANGEGATEIDKMKQLMELFSLDDSSEASESDDQEATNKQFDMKPTSQCNAFLSSMFMTPIVQVGGAPKKRKADTTEEVAEEKYENKSQRLLQLIEKTGEVKMRVEQDAIRCNITDAIARDFALVATQLQKEPKVMLETLFGRLSEEDVESFIESIGTSRNPPTRFLAVARVAYQFDYQNLKRVKTLATMCEKHIVKMVEHVFTANFAASNGEIQWSKVLSYLSDRKHKPPHTTSRGTGDDGSSGGGGGGGDGGGNDGHDDDDPELLPDADDKGDAPKKSRGRPKNK
eukprot:symbB.v1.2.037028.t1/scaffold5356.1/size31972/1